MNLSEYQAKNILRELGFTVPAGVVCESVDMADVLASTLSTEQWVIKAQILAGGRARGFFRDDPQQQGGIRFARSLGQLRGHCRQMLGGTLVTEQTGKSGEVVHSVYLEERHEVVQESYLGLTIDPEQGQLAFIASASGGSNIESTAASQPDQVQRFAVTIDQPFLQGEAIAHIVGVPFAQRVQFAQCLQNMVAQFVAKDMLLIEINPLALDNHGAMIALDATVVFDDNALFRQGHEEQMDAYVHLSAQEYTAAVQGLNLVKLDGDIATLSAGAGLAMATIDAIWEYGGEAANFLDVPPSAAVSRLHDAVNLLLQDSATQCLLINVFGGGIMRCDAVVDALLLANREAPFKVPVVVRLAGTNSALGKERLAASLPNVLIASDLAEAARLCCSLTAALVESGRDQAHESTGNATRLWQKLMQWMPGKPT